MENNKSNLIKIQEKTSLETAKDYLLRGWMPLPIPFRSKKPNLKGWQNFQVSESDLSEHFNNSMQNIGVLLGSTSNNLIDVDLDSFEAVKIADYFLPETKAVFGRKSKPRSHRLYLCPDGHTEKFQLGEMIAEIRFNGCQTVFPFSVHQSGELIEWTEQGEPKDVSFKDLRQSVGKLASVCVLSKFWTDGNRHALSMAIAGTLARNGFALEDALLFVKAICHAKSDDEPSDRLESVKTTYKRFANGEKITGFPTLIELTDKKTVEKIIDWLSFNREQSSEKIQSSITVTNDESLPEHFIMKDDGLYYVSFERGKEKIEEVENFVCSPLHIVAETKDIESNNWGRMVEFTDRSNIKHSINFPMSLLAGDNTEIRARLLDSGLIITPNKQHKDRLAEYLLMSKKSRTILCVNQLGWHDDAFVLPDETISNENDSKEFVMQNVDRSSNKFKTKGTLTDWQENISKYCVGNSRLMFAVSMAFASSILPFSSVQSGGFHFRGISSTGKTTALTVAGSVWGGGKNGFLETWRATANGFEAVAELHNHSLLLLDEISQVNPHEVGEIIYSLANGFGKSRMTKNVLARRKAEWKLIFCSSGEKSLDDLTASVGQRTHGGQEARFADIEADANKGFGLFENLHGFSNGANFSTHLDTASKQFYGVAIREFLKAVVSNKQEVEKAIADSTNKLIERYKTSNWSGEVYRVASRFALVGVAGALATKFGVTGWDNKEVFPCAERMFKEWLESRGTVGNMDTANGVKQVLAFIEMHGSSRFQSVNDSQSKIQNRVGFYRDNFQGEKEFLFLPEMFKREVCKGFNVTLVAKELEKLGHLHRGSEKQSLTQKTTNSELGRMRFYVLTYNNLKDFQDEQDEETTN